VTIRAAIEDDLPAIAAIQAASPEMSAWDPPGYLEYNCRVAVMGGLIAGFLVSREVATGEREILKVAVHPTYRRHGVARKLVQEELASYQGTWFLEVRESNAAAINLYRSLGFMSVVRRQQYYENPAEAAIVMRFLS
jgi:ribosomal-protein-alanine acetyltransferase